MYFYVPNPPETWLEQKIYSTDASWGGRFGDATGMSADGSTAVFGDQPATVSGDIPVHPSYGPGKAYIFTNTNASGVWTEQQIIEPADGVAVPYGEGPQYRDYFGKTVALNEDGNTVAIVSHNTVIEPLRAYAGAVYIWTRTGETWTQQDKIESDAPIQSDYFGQTIGISADGNTLAVGSRLPPDNTGQVYVYTRSGSVWSLQQQFKSSDFYNGQYFGRYLALSGDGDTLVTRGGSKHYVWTRTGGVWSEEQILDTNFGGGIALSDDGNTLLIGDSSDDTMENNAGAVYSWTRSLGVWTQEQKILPSIGNDGGQFGSWDKVRISSDGLTFISKNYSEVYEPIEDYEDTILLFTKIGGVWSNEKRLNLTRSRPEDGAIHSFGGVTNGGELIVVGRRDEYNAIIDAYSGAGFFLTKD
jgi:hypothetical protein